MKLQQEESPLIYNLRVHPFFLSRLLCVAVFAVPCPLQDVRRLREIGGNARKTRKMHTQREGTINEKGGKERERKRIGTATTPRGSLATRTTTRRLHSNYLHILPGIIVCVCVCLRTCTSDWCPCVYVRLCLPASCLSVCVCACACCVRAFVCLSLVSSPA